MSARNKIKAAIAGLNGTGLVITFALLGFLLLAHVIGMDIGEGEQFAVLTAVIMCLRKSFGVNGDARK